MQGELKEKRGKFNLPRDGSSLWVGKTKAFWNNKPGVITLRGARRGETRIERALPPSKLRDSSFEDLVTLSNRDLTRSRIRSSGRVDFWIDSSEGKKQVCSKVVWKEGIFPSVKVGEGVRVSAKGWRWITACSLLPVGRKKWKFEYNIYVKGNRRRIWNANGIERERDGQTFSQKC